MRVFRQIFCLKNLISSMRLITEIQSEIERRSLSSGGWATANGRRAGIETTCYALMALRDRQSPIRDKAMDFLQRTQNPDGSWPAFDGDDPEGCWTTALAIITLRFIGGPSAPIERSLFWLLGYAGREGHWFWKWKFRTVERAVQFDPDKYGWPWFPGTVSWVIPTAFSLIALKQSFAYFSSQQVAHRIQLGTEMLRDRACPEGGWNAGNSIVFGAGLKPHIDSTAIALLGLTDATDPVAVRALEWIRPACLECPSAYSLAWSAIALSLHEDETTPRCIADLHRVLSSVDAISDVETLSLAVLAIQSVEGPFNPFRA
jgi:squalene cyclase